MSGAPLDPQLVSTYYTYVLVFFAALAAVSAIKLLVRRGRSGNNSGLTNHTVW